ncbi:MAG: hypothetical protein ACREIB_09915 [Pseudomonadota bacterium]
MTSTMPRVVVEGDTAARVMACHGQLLGFGRARAVWRFGFVPGGSLARAFRAAAEQPLWALSVHSGTVLEVFAGSWERAWPLVDLAGSDLPVRFRNTLAVRL